MSPDDNNHGNKGHSRRTLLGASVAGLLGLAAASSQPAAAASWEDHDHSGDFGGKTNLGASSPVSSITVDDVLTRNSPHRNVKAYGAVGDGSTDDTAAIQSALDAANDGDTIFLPPGTYRVTSTLSQSNKSLAIVGMGSGTSTIRAEHGTNGIGLNPEGGAARDRIVLLGFTLLTTRSDAGTGIDCRWDDIQSSQEHLCVIDDVEISGTDYPNNGWANGIILEEAWHSYVTNTNIRGREVGSGVKLIGQCIGTVFDKLTVFFHNSGVNIDNPNEGIRITNTNLVAVDTGVFCQTGDRQPPNIVVLNSHAAARKHGILLRDHSQGIIVGNLIYKRKESDQDFDAIKVNNCLNYRISDNCVVILDEANDTGFNRGYVVLNSKDVTLHGNQIGPADTAMLLGSNTDHSIASLNTGRGISNGVVDDGTSNVVTNNIMY